MTSMTGTSHFHRLLHTLFFFCLGLTATVAQVVLLRDFFSNFYGNELIFGVVFFGWLLLTGLGSVLLRNNRLTFSFSSPTIALMLTSLSLASFAALLLVRIAKHLLSDAPGELLGPDVMLLIVLPALMLFCIPSGFLFAAISRWSEKNLPTSRDKVTTTGYLTESIGALIGGLLIPVMLLLRMNHIQMLLAAFFVNFLVLIIVSLQEKKYWRTGLAFLCAVGIFSAVPTLSRITLKRLWEPFDIEKQFNTPYHQVLLLRSSELKMIFLNGTRAYVYPDPEAAEEKVHFALLEHPAPGRILLIGGGFGGTLLEILKHPSVQRIDYVEFDADLLQFFQEHFQTEYQRIRESGKVFFHTGDPRNFLRKSNQLYDIILCNLPAPSSGQWNRFYTVEFYRVLAGHLNWDGIFSFSVPGAANYITAERASFLRSLYFTLKKVFLEVIVFPGETIHFFAGRRPSSITDSPDTLIQRLRQRKIQTLYLRDFSIRFRLMPDRVQELNNLIHQPEYRLNRDFEPIATYFDILLWSRLFLPQLRAFFVRLSEIPRRGWLIALFLFSVFFLFRFRKDVKDRMLNRIPRFSIACTGFSMIGFELILLWLFQILNGYVYEEMALIIAGFMSGLALGSWMGIRRQRGQSGPYTPKNGLLSLSGGHAILAGMAMIFGGTAVFSEPLGVLFSNPVTSRVLFLLLALVTGGMGGFMYFLNSRIYFLGDHMKEKKQIGSIYGWDLFGSAFGALFVGVFLLTLYGIMFSLIFLGLMNTLLAASLVFLARSWKIGRHPV